MTYRGTLLLGVVALLAASSQAAVPAVLPEITVQVDPGSPTSSDILSLTLSGTWPDSCTPEGLETHVLAGDSIWIDLLLPGWDTKGPCDPLMCLQVLTPWQQTEFIAPVPAGDYDLFARAVACEGSGSYAKIGTLRVEPGAGGPLPDQFARGERVVLLEDDPSGGPGLLAGHAGTIVCCDPSDCSGGVLISWDLWTNGKADLSRCPDIASVVYPPESVIWVDPSRTLIGRHFNQCGTIRQGLEGCVHLDAADGKTYNLVAPGQLYATLDKAGAIQFGDTVRVRGLLNTTPPGPGVFRICPQFDGDVYHPIVVPCVKGEPDPDPKPDPDPDPKPDPDQIIIGLGENAIVLAKDPGGPAATYSGCVDLDLELNFRGLLSVEITPAAGVVGTWTGTLSPEVVGPGSATTTLCVTVEGLDISTLPPGKGVQIAVVSLFVVPAP